MPKDFIFVTHGIRLHGDQSNDQKRFASPGEAIIIKPSSWQVKLTISSDSVSWLK